MAISNYNSNNICKYSLDRLEKVVYLLAEKDWKISIDNGEAYISGVTATPLSIEAYAVELSDSEELDERYKFTHTLKFSVNGYANYKDFGGRYYAIVKSKDNVYWLLNPMFPCKVTYTYTLGANENHTDFEMATVSNHPVLMVKGMTQPTPYNCNGYAHSSFKTLKLNEKAYSSHNRYFVQYTNDGFKDIEFNKNSQVYTETFDGTFVSHSIKFNIRFDNYKSSWHYNLLEFKENLYSAIIGTSDGKSIFIGFDYGLQPSFNVAASSSNSSNIEITLTNIFDNGDLPDIYDNVYITKNTDLAYIYTTEYDGWECVGVNTARYLLKKEVDAYGNPTGKYQCYIGYRSYFEAKGLTIVGTFSSTETFYNTSCVNTCNLNTNMPNRISFNSTGCKTYNIKADTNWSISSNKNYITVSPTSGVANSSYTVSVCNSSTPTSATSSATLTLNYCNRANKVDVYVTKDSCFPKNRYSITAQGQYVTIPTQCCISSVTSSSSTIGDITIQQGYIKLWVPENESTASSRSFTVRVYKCDGDYEDIIISQRPLYERWRLIYGEWICDNCTNA